MFTPPTAPATPATLTYRDADGFPMKRSNAIYAAETCIVLFTEATGAMNAMCGGALEADAREAMRKDWMLVNMQSRPYAELIINDEVSFFRRFRRDFCFIVRCTAENTVTVMINDEPAALE